MPQNVDYIVNVMNAAKDVQDAHFIMCGSGTEFYKISDYGSGEKMVMLRL